jgi:signal transduction histidine kinase
MVHKKIILVDDNPTNLTACKLALRDIYDVYPVNSAEQMFDLLAKMIPDLILLDVEMPVMDGYEAAKILKSNPDFKEIPLIFLTAKEDMESELEGLTLGAYDYIRKPIVKVLLRRRIETVLSLIDVQKELTARNKSIRDLLDMKTNEVTLRRAAEEEALRASLAKSEFLSRMSHEIRTPLNAIIGMITIATRTADMDKIGVCLKKADTASKHLLNLINDILDISKIEEGKLELSASEFAFKKMVNNVISVVKVRADEKDIELSVNLGSDVPSYVNADALRLSQVITNLLTNAIKFTPQKGNVTLNIAKIESDSPLVTLKIEVVDNGIGISKEQQRKLFQPFEQANSKIAQQFGGTGLGLAISKQFIEMMDGSIWIESEPDEGAKFIFTIKVEESSGESVVEGPGSTDGEHYDFSGHTILIAEDVEVNREIILAILEDTGLSIEFAVNGQEAVEMFTANPNRYKLIMMDVQMPVMNGHEATRAIRNSDAARAKEIAIIAMTANVFKEDIDACLTAGMNSHIGKPIAFGALFELLKKWLEA